MSANSGGGLEKSSVFNLLFVYSSKLEIESLKEYNGHLKEAAWAKDSEAARCRQCEREFTLARRKVSMGEDFVGKVF